MDADLQRALNVVVSKLKKLEGAVNKNIKSDLRTAAAGIVLAIKAKTPVGKVSQLRKGVSVKPGNLKKSIRVLPLRRTRGAVVVGPLARGRNPDGFYGRFVEFGTSKMRAKPFVEPAVSASYPQAQRFAIELIKRRIEAYTKQNAI